MYMSRTDICMAVPSAALLAGGPVMLEYRIGEAGEWTPYRDPVEIPRASGTYVYVRSDKMPEALLDS